MRNLVDVGCAAPALGPPCEWPRVVAFVHEWNAAPDDVAAIRAELRGLGAELVVVAREATWAFGPDDPVERIGGPARGAARLFGVDGEAVFVIDQHGTIRLAHRGPVGARLCDALAAAGDAMLAPRVTFTRREWNLTALVSGFALVFLSNCKTREKPKPAQPATATTNGEIAIALHVNGKVHELRVDPRTSLLDALRERLALTGTKKGCDMGQCGACTVLADGKRVLACMTLAVMAQQAKYVTIEGLARGDELHPMQAAFIEHDGLQCGYCTPGQILSAVALLAEGRAKTDAEVREQMSGNLCRCGAQPNIVTAIQAVRRGGA